VLGASQELIFASMATNLIIFVGIGHNLPIFNTVIVDDNTMLFRIKFLILLLLIGLILSFGVTLHLLMVNK